MTSSRGTNATDGTNDTSVTQRSSRRGIVNMLKVKKARTKGVVQKVIKVKTMTGNNYLLYKPLKFYT